VSPSCSRRSCGAPASPPSPPAGITKAPLRALIFDSYYDRYRGAIPSIRGCGRHYQTGNEVAFGAHRDDVYEVDEVGYLQLGPKPTEQLEAGEVGYLVANVRGVREIRPGDRCSMPSIETSRSCPGTATSSRWSSRTLSDQRRAVRGPPPTRWRSCS